MDNEKIKWMFLGGVLAIVVMLLVGATDISAPNYGRYQLSSWSSSVGDDKAVVGAFVIDTATGETRNVYTRLVDTDGHGRVMKNGLKETFHSVD